MARMSRYMKGPIAWGLDNAVCVCTYVEPGLSALETAPRVLLLLVVHHVTL